MNNAHTRVINCASLIVCNEMKTFQDKDNTHAEVTNRAPLIACYVIKTYQEKDKSHTRVTNYASNAHKRVINCAFFIVMFFSTNVFCIVM